jgi:tetratricopeptide (TPR) repeat protein
MSAEVGNVSSIGGFFARLRKKRIPEILAGFVGGGWLILEFVHWILIDHYHFPENTLDVTFITLLCALSCTLTWRVFGGAEKRKRKFKIEFVLIPVLILVTAFFDIRLVRQAARHEKPSLGDAGGTPPGNAGLKINPKRVVVAPFENKTGDPSLDPIGSIAADWITQGISQINVLEVSPQGAPAASGKPDKGKPGSGSGPIDLKALSEETGAGTVITGSYYLSGEDLEFQFQITDVLNSRLLRAMAGIKGKLRSRMETIDVLCRRIMGAMAQLSEHSSTAAFGETPTPPLYDAYREFMLGVELFGGDYAEAERHLIRANEIDPGFLLPTFWIAVAKGNQGEYAKADVLIRRLDQDRERLAPYERHLLDWYDAVIHGRYEDCLRSAQEAVRLAPWSTMLRFVVGSAALEANRPQITVDTYLTFSQDDKERTYARPTGQWYIENLAEAYHMLGQYEEELEEVRKAQKYFRDNLAVKADEVRALAALGKADEIADAVVESLASASTAGTAGEVMLEAAAELRAHGMKERSRAYAQKALQWYTDKEAGDAAGEARLNDLAGALYAAERWEEARTIFNELCTKNPENPDYLGRLGTLAARLGDRTEALRISEKLKAFNRPFLFGRSPFFRARVASILGDRDQAIALLREAIAQGLRFDVSIHRNIDFEPLWDYAPFKELIKPKS